MTNNVASPARTLFCNLIMILLRTSASGDFERLSFAPHPIHRWIVCSIALLSVRYNRLMSSSWFSSLTGILRGLRFPVGSSLLLRLPVQLSSSFVYVVRGGRMGGAVFGCSSRVDPGCRNLLPSTRSPCHMIRLLPCMLL